MNVIIKKLIVPTYLDNLLDICKLNWTIWIQTKPNTRMEMTSFNSRRHTCILYTRYVHSREFLFVRSNHIYWCDAVCKLMMHLLQINIAFVHILNILKYIIVINIAASRSFVYYICFFSSFNYHCQVYIETKA